MKKTFKILTCKTFKIILYNIEQNFESKKSWYYLIYKKQ